MATGLDRLQQLLQLESGILGNEARTMSNQRYRALMEAQNFAGETMPHLRGIMSQDIPVEQKITDIGRFLQTPGGGTPRISNPAKDEIYNRMLSGDFGGDFSKANAGRGYAHAIQLVGRTEDGNSFIKHDPNTGRTWLESVPKGAESILPKTDQFGSAAEAKDLADVDVLRGQLDFIDEKYKPEYVGLMDNYAGAVTAYFNGDEATFRRTVDSVKDTLLRLKSGAQINEQEYARLSKIVPNYSMGEEQFVANLGDFRRELDLVLSSKKSRMSERGVVGKKSQKRDMKPFDVNDDALWNTIERDLGTDYSDEALADWLDKNGYEVE